MVIKVHQGDTGLYPQPSHIKQDFSSHFFPGVKPFLFLPSGCQKGSLEEPEQ